MLVICTATIVQWTVIVADHAGHFAMVTASPSYKLMLSIDFTIVDDDDDNAIDLQLQANYGQKESRSKQEKNTKE